MRRAFSVDKLLSRYFTPPEINRFRELQCQTGTLISGSTALQFFDRAIYPESDLDLYVEYRLSAAIAAWLLEIGYTYAPYPESENSPTLDEAFKNYTPNEPPVPAETPSEDIFFAASFEFENYRKASGVFNFEKQYPYRKVQLVTSLHSPLSTVLSFHFSTFLSMHTK